MSEEDVQLLRPSVEEDVYVSALLLWEICFAHAAQRERVVLESGQPENKLHRRSNESACCCTDVEIRIVVRRNAASDVSHPALDDLHRRILAEPHDEWRQWWSIRVVRVFLLEGLTEQRFHAAGQLEVKAAPPKSLACVGVLEERLDKFEPLQILLSRFDLPDLKGMPLHANQVHGEHAV